MFEAINIANNEKVVVKILKVSRFNPKEKKTMPLSLILKMMHILMLGEN